MKLEKFRVSARAEGFEIEAQPIVVTRTLTVWEGDCRQGTNTVDFIATTGSGPIRVGLTKGHECLTPLLARALEVEIKSML